MLNALNKFYNTILYKQQLVKFDKCMFFVGKIINLKCEVYD